MKREIKFRAWMPVGEWSEDVENQAMKMVYDIAFEEYAPLNDHLGNVDAIMQFTGLYDKNKKEIWEGDILCEVGDNGYDIFDVVEWDAKRGRWICGEEAGEDFHYYRVLGNKYENAGLLEVEEDI